MANFKIKLEILESRCRSGYCKKGDVFILENDICPPICAELWNCIYPYVFALQNGAVLDDGDAKSKSFTAKCPDEERVIIRGEVIEK